MHSSYMIEHVITFSFYQLLQAYGHLTSYSVQCTLFIKYYIFRSVQPELTGSILTCQHDFSPEWRTYYDHRYVMNMC